MPDKMRVPVAEIFESIQGEGRYAGAYQIFVRLAGCPVGCYYCDTQHTAEAAFSAGGTEYPNPVSVDMLVDILWREFEPEACHSISFTGGEPMLYAAFLRGMSLKIRRKGDVKLFLETSGHDPSALLEILPYFDYISLDLKTTIAPFETHAAKLLQAVSGIPPSKLYLKFVLSEQEDGHVVTTAARLLKQEKISEIWLQPVDNRFDFRKVLSWQKEMKKYGVSAYFVPQIHKLIHIS